MNTFARLIKTDSYFNIFNILHEEVKKIPNRIDDKAFIFCEEKISLLAENVICDAVNGSFSFMVYSFGNYLKQKLTDKRVLSKEGTSMVLRRLLKDVPLKCFSKSRNGLSTSMANLIALLKSAKVGVSDIERAKECANGVLKNKLQDIYEIYRAYENFIIDNGFDDQSSVLSYLPGIILDDENINNADIILLGYSSWTKQIVDIVSVLLKKAKSITVITTSNNNSFVFVNEIENIFSEVCEKNDIALIRENILSPYVKEAKFICDNIFNPKTYSIDKLETDRIINISADNEFSQIEKVGQIIKSKVYKGARYSDFTIAVSDGEKLEYSINKVFSKLDIPYFLDIKKKGKNSALVALILSYIEIIRKNFERDNVIDFIKNPLFGLDKRLADDFENYLIKYNVNYKRFFEPFSLSELGEPLTEYNAIREKVIDITSTFSIEKMLESLCVEERQQELSIRLRQNGYNNEASINDQIYDYVLDIINEMNGILKDDASLLDIKETFISGINALELSIIPEYKDAVFIGGFKEGSLIQNKYVFALNLTADVPAIKEDVSILSDNDLAVLDGLQMIIEPKIKIVNHREREHVASFLSSFTKNLFYCSPISSNDGKNNVKSEIVDYLENMFTTHCYSDYDNYLTYKQGVENFSKDCTMYADGRLIEFSPACDFYHAVKEDERVKDILEKANSEIVKDITINRSMAVGVSSPTSLESYSACPYKTFIELYLRVKNRDNGEVNPLSVGTLIHEVFEKFAKKIDQVKDRESCDKIVLEILDKILLKDEYAKYLLNLKESATINRIKKEVSDYCFKIYLSFNNSLFKPKYIEKKFGEGESLPPISLLGGNVKLKGKIDRVDEYKDYVRIVDYKTGNVHVKKEELFTGNKLQLYLYGRVFDDKKIAGAYYMPVNNSYVSLDKKESVLFQGDTLNEEEILIANDTNIQNNNKSNIISATIKDGEIKKAVSAEKMKAFTEYAFRISEKIVSLMSEGYIPASPLNDICSYCAFSGICGDRMCLNRTTLKVDEQTIEDAIKGGKE